MPDGQQVPDPQRLGPLFSGDLQRLVDPDVRMGLVAQQPGNGIMLQLAEVGNHFYIDWYQGFHGDMYAKAMRDIMKEAGIKGVRLERVE